MSQKLKELLALKFKEKYSQAVEKQCLSVCKKFRKIFLLKMRSPFTDSVTCLYILLTGGQFLHMKEKFSSNSIISFLCLINNDTHFIAALSSLELVKKNMQVRIFLGSLEYSWYAVELIYLNKYYRLNVELEKYQDKVRNLKNQIDATDDCHTVTEDSGVGDAKLIHQTAKSGQLVLFVSNQYYEKGILSLGSPHSTSNAASTICWNKSRNTHTHDSFT